MHPYVSTHELFNGNAVALHDLDLDLFIAKGHHDEDAINRLLQSGDGVPPVFRDYQVAAGTVTHTWTRFAWHRPGCDEVGEDSPWCLCGLDEGGSRDQWFPQEADPSSTDAIPVAWFTATRMPAA